MKFLCIFVLASVLIISSIGVTLNRCSLARQMHALGVPRSELAQWACIAQHESAYRTGVVGPPNRDGSRDYGIFQINDRYWCQPANRKFSYNGCRISCNALLTDNISNSVSCARRIRSQQGWAAWSVWRHCSGRLRSINDCF